MEVDSGGLTSLVFDRIVARRSLDKNRRSIMDQTMRFTVDMHVPRIKPSTEGLERAGKCHDGVQRSDARRWNTEKKNKLRVRNPG